MDDIRSLYVPGSDQQVSDDRRDPDALASWTAELDVTALEAVAKPGEHFRLDTLSGMTLEAEVQDVNNIDGSQVICGKLAQDGAWFTMTRHGNGLYGLFRTDRGQVEIRNRAGRLLVHHLRPEPNLRCGGGIPMKSTGAPRPNPQQMELQEHSQVDALVVFTRGALSEANDLNSFITIVRTAEKNANRIYQNSQIDLVLRVVGIEQIAFAEGESVKGDLGRIPHDEQTQTLREQYKADVVVLVRAPDNVYLGISYQLSNFSDPKGGESFTVVDDRHIARYDVMAHEIGHQLGCQHDPAHADSTPLFDFSYGHFFKGNSGTVWGTVMSYEGSRRDYFSNPGVLYDGQPTGLANARDNARTINLSKNFVSKYRLAPQVLPAGK